MFNKEDFDKLNNLQKTDSSLIRNTIEIISNNCEEFIEDNKLLKIEDVDNTAEELMANYLRQDSIFYEEKENGVQNSVAFAQFFEKQYGDAFYNLVRIEAQLNVLLNKILNKKHN